jgi:hypothetical protein
LVGGNRLFIFGSRFWDRQHSRAAGFDYLTQQTRSPKIAAIQPRAAFRVRQHSVLLLLLMQRDSRPSCKHDRPYVNLRGAIWIKQFIAKQCTGIQIF